MTPDATMLRILLVDDEQPARERMKEVLGDIAGDLPNTVVGEAASGHEGLRLLPTLPVDVALVDIHMPQMTGMEFARHATIIERAPAVVFVTAHDQYAVEAFEVNAIDYLLKPVRASRLLAALQRARTAGAVQREPLERAAAAAGQGPRRYLSVTERGRIHLVPVADIVYLRAELKYVTIRTAARELVIEESLSALEQEFADTFIRVHRSCLVARAAVLAFERAVDEDGEGAGWAAVLEGITEKMPISRRQWPVVKTLATR
jgi:two-component system response regulator AlgR